MVCRIHKVHFLRSLQLPHFSFSGPKLLFKGLLIPVDTCTGDTPLIDKSITTYNVSNVCHFRKTDEPCGGLSNMCSGYPLRVNGVRILTTESLYQSCRFPHLPEVQEVILQKKSPMSSKMFSKRFLQATRSDWDDVRVDIMRWCLQIKLSCHYLKFGQLLGSTSSRDIVEISHNDRFWGAVRQRRDQEVIEGNNILGKLLIELRGKYLSTPFKDLLYVEPLGIPDFLLFGEPINGVDQRFKIAHFISSGILTTPFPDIGAEDDYQSVA